MLLQTVGAHEPSCLDQRHFGSAEVVAASATDVTVALGVHQVDARLAVLNYQPHPGDEVLVAGDWQNGFFVIGVLRTGCAGQPSAVTSLTRPGCTRVEIEEGDLEFVARRGNIRLVSAGGIEMTAMEPIDVRSRTAIRMSIFGNVGRLLSKFNLFGRTAELSSQSIDINAGDLQSTAERTRIVTNRTDADLGDVRILGKRINLVAGMVVSKVNNVYQHVSGLWQLAAGRSRSVVEGTSHHKANRIYSKAVKDVKIDGEKIHLG